ncbi:MAG TPA: 3-hydroxyacyl-CoA dehydrogenase NAD-binding domain-containing protein [Polyangiaceae bacterium]|nr:3-hydroxyacyl-CoA dehydrogenase NAD-binding domain-containing protein [Polyangiaceae bacterium]
MELSNIGVVGAGVMGVGLAQALAQSGLQVVLLDLSDDQLAAARTKIKDGVRLQMMLGGGAKVSPDAVLANIECSTDYDALARVDFVIENVTERWSTKEPVYRALAAACKPEAVFAVNTSAISITKIASISGRADRVVGMHFMNPVPMKPTVEVIRGFHTSEETLRIAHALLGKINKQGIVVNDSPGFVSNRVLMLTINEAVFLVQEGVASAPDVDRIFKECFGHKMGPLETADLIGLDTILLSLEALYDGFLDPKFRPCPLLSKLVAAGQHGRKTGAGFHKYG